MFTISLLHQLIFFTLLCLLVLLLLFAKRKALFYSARPKSMWRALAVFSLVYGLIVGYAAYDELHMQWRLSQYDGNQNGRIEGLEQTPEASRLMEYSLYNRSNNLAVYVGLPIAGVLALLIYVDSRIWEWKKKRRDNLKRINTKDK